MLKLDEPSQVFKQDVLLDMEVRLWCEDIERDKRLDKEITHATYITPLLRHFFVPKMHFAGKFSTFLL